MHVRLQRPTIFSDLCWMAGVLDPPRSTPDTRIVHIAQAPLGCDRRTSRGHKPRRGERRSLLQNTPLVEGKSVGVLRRFCIEMVGFCKAG